MKQKNAPSAIGPYSQAICFNGILYASGQIPINPDTGDLVENDIEKQTRQVLKNIDAVLLQAGTTKDKIVKTTIFITNINNSSQVNDIYADYFKGTIFPARSTVEVSALPKGALVEIEVIAGV